MKATDPFGWVGATIDGKYRVDEVAGEGGFGVVYRGHHLGFDEPVAIKCLKIPREIMGADRAAFQRTFLEEGKLLHRLSRATAGIVQALDVGAAVSPLDAWTPYLVLEWLRGEPLDRDLLDRRARGAPPRSLAEAVALLAPAARALAAAHAQGVAHRDVKPANLFLAEIGDRRTLKVLDFGIAKVLSEASSMTQALAETGASVKAFTPQYGAPEQFHRRYGATGPWTDVFALALVLIEVASGRTALEGADTTQLYIASTDPGFRPSLKAAGVDAPEAVHAVVRQALSVDPRDRYRSAGELWDALEAALPEAKEAARRATEEGGPFKPHRGVPSLSEDVGSMPTGEFMGLSDTARAAPPLPADRAALELAGTAPAPVPPTRQRTDEAPAAPDPAASDPGAPAPAALPPTAPAALNSAGPAVVPHAVPPRRARSSAPVIAMAAGMVVVSAAAGFWLVRRSAPPPPPAPVVERAVVAAPEPPVLPGMVRIDAGKFTMGIATGGKTEKPPHEVTISRAFYLDRTEVTAADYQRCVKEGKCSPSGVHGPHAEPTDVDKRGSLCTANDPAKARHPITCVDQAQASAYCKWAGKRLPTEAEWEYAARGLDGREYPWGNDAPSCDHANVARNPGQGCGRPKGTMDVGSLPAGASAQGALDLAGNAWEWVADGWDPAAYAKGSQVDPLVPTGGEKAVLRGGSWDFAGSSAKTTSRLAFDRAAGDVATGFRCARTVE